jgi:hypothetical protein
MSSQRRDLSVRKNSYHNENGRAILIWQAAQNQSRALKKGFEEKTSLLWSIETAFRDALSTIHPLKTTVHPNYVDI